MWMRIGLGLTIFTVGFAKKVLIADRLALFVDPLFKQAVTRVLGFGEAWSAVLGFSFQLFLDFSAYTEMAIGTALIFGFLLPENFRRPPTFPLIFAISGAAGTLRCRIFCATISTFRSVAAGMGWRAISSPRSPRWACAVCGMARAGLSLPGVYGMAWG
jgi:hypothetical protein